MGSHPCFHFSLLVIQTLDTLLTLHIKDERLSGRWILITSYKLSRGYFPSKSLIIGKVRRWWGIRTTAKLLPNPKWFSLKSPILASQ